MSAYRYKLSLVREEAPPPFGTQVSQSAESAELARSLLADEFQEVALAMFFDRKNRLTGFMEVGRGTIDQCPMPPREILVAAFAANAAAIMVAHNHPSGSLQPSPADHAITSRLKRACELVGIVFLDHLIVGAGGAYVSLLHDPLQLFQGSPQGANNTSATPDTTAT